MIYDLHCHSDLSDGELSPAELVQRAHDNGVSFLSITDHDSLAVYRSPALSVPAGLTLVPGIELSTQWRGRGIHIVGLNVDPFNETLVAGALAQQQVRVQRAGKIAQRLERAGHSGALARATELANGNAIGRPHFATFLVEIGAVKTSKAAFRKYLGTGKTGDVRRDWATMDEVVNWIDGAGGVAVIAHPAHYKLTNTRLRELVDDFQAMGGRGIEVVSGSQTLDTTQKLAKIANEKGLFASCGSDFHRPAASWSDLGRFPSLPDTCTPVWHAWY